jgi:hypothetical protein
MTGSVHSERARGSRCRAHGVHDTRFGVGQEGHPGRECARGGLTQYLFKLDGLLAAIAREDALGGMGA